MSLFDYNFGRLTWNTTSEEIANYLCSDAAKVTQFKRSKIGTKEKININKRGIKVALMSWVGTYL